MIQLQPEAFGFLVDHNNGPTIGMQILTAEDSYLVPLDIRSAQYVGNLLLVQADSLTKDGDTPE